MTREEIIRMARSDDWAVDVSLKWDDFFVRFANLVAAAEREAITEEPTQEMLRAITEQFDSDFSMGIGFNPQTLCRAVLSAIRARGEKA